VDVVDAYVHRVELVRSIVFKFCTDKWPPELIKRVSS
jgi:hypothetical protein